MFERIGIGTGHCHFCGGYGPVAVLFKVGAGVGADVEACEKCIRAAVKAADLLKVLRAAKAKPPKKARNQGKKAPAASRSAPVAAAPIGPYDRDELTP